MLTLLRLPFQPGLGASEWSPLRSRPYAILISPATAFD